MRSSLFLLISGAAMACTSTIVPPDGPPDPLDPPPVPTDPDDPTDPTDPTLPDPVDCDATAPAGSDLGAAAATLPDGGVLCLGAGLHEEGLGLVDRELTVQGLPGARLTGPIAASGGAVRLESLTFEETSGGAAIRLADTLATLADVTVRRGAAAGPDAAGGVDSRGTDLTVLGLEIAEIAGTGLFAIGGSL
ncbi:MAG: hypothetical protein AAF211_29335, partial [Myxococcota bacterium]